MLEVVKDSQSTVNPSPVTVSPDGTAVGSSSYGDRKPSKDTYIEESIDNVRQEGLSRKESIRRTLSKQQGVDDSVLSTVTSLPVVKSSFDEPADGSSMAQPSVDESVPEMIPRARQLVRGLALCGDDDTKLRPPPPVTLQRHQHSLSRESSGTEYTDSSGIDLRSFINSTLHKNPRDRQMILQLEEQLTKFVNDTSIQAYKFPPMSSYNRMLIHRVAVVFGLDHNVDNSGQCIVVNKTDKSCLPDFEFTSLIKHDNFTDSKKFCRSFDSHEEIRDPMLYGIPRNMEQFPRRAQSFEASSMMQHSAANSWIQANHANNHSFDAVSSGIPRHMTNGTSMLRKAGSFGGVPEYYRTGSADSGRPVSRIHHYPSNGSMTHASPREKIEELSEVMSGMHVDVPVHHLQQQAYESHASPAQEMYGPSYQQPLYVQPPMMSPHAMYSPHGQMIPIQTVQYGPQVVYPQWSPGYNYMDSSVAMQPIQVATYTPSQPMVTEPIVYNTQQVVPHVVTAPQMTSHTNATQRYYVPVPHVVTRVESCPHAPPPPSSVSITRHHTMLASVDGGYGSMTQDSLKESE